MIMNRLYNFYLLLFVLLFIFNIYPVLAQYNSGDEQEIIAKGLGAIIGGDEAKAADDALSSALRSAVEQVVGMMIQSDILVENYQVVEDRIYSQTMGYVKSYNVISQTKRGDNIIETTIRAIVKRSNLENDLNAIGLLMVQKNKPRLMVLIDEVNMERHYFYNHYDLGTTANELINKFLEKGFTFVDRDVAIRNLQRDAALAAVEGDAKSAQTIAQETGAEVLIVGKAISKAASGGPSVLRDAGMVSCQATLNLRAVRADDGSVIGVTSQQAAAVHVDHVTGGTQALIKASGLAAEDLSKKILKTWQKDIYSGATVQLRVLEVPSFSDLMKFKNMIKTYVRGVQEVYQRDYAGNTALFDVDVRGDAQHLAEELTLKDFEPYRINVVNVSQNSLIVKLSLKTMEQQNDSEE
jgi:hypothetical protein